MPETPVDATEATPAAPVPAETSQTFEEAVLSRLSAIEATQEGLRAGVNTIGAMMNDVANAFGQIMEQVNKGGIGALLGGMMGGKKNG